MANNFWDQYATASIQAESYGNIADDLTSQKLQKLQQRAQDKINRLGINQQERLGELALENQIRDGSNIAKSDILRSNRPSDILDPTKKYKANYTYDNQGIITGYTYDEYEGDVRNAYMRNLGIDPNTGEQMQKFGLARSDIADWAKKEGITPEQARYMDKERSLWDKIVGKKSVYEGSGGEYDGTPGEWAQSQGPALMDMQFEQDPITQFEYQRYKDPTTIAARVMGTEDMNGKIYGKLGAGGTEYTLDSKDPLFNINAQQVDKVPEGVPVPKVPHGFDEEGNKLSDIDMLINELSYLSSDNDRNGYLGNLIDAGQAGIGTFLAKTGDTAIDGLAKLSRMARQVVTEETGKELNDKFQEDIKGTFIEKYFSKDGDFIGLDKYKEQTEYGYGPKLVNEADKSFRKAWKSGKTGDIIDAVIDIVQAGPDLFLTSSGDMMAAAAGPLGWGVYAGNFQNEILEERAKEVGGIYNLEAKDYAIAGITAIPAAAINAFTRGNAGLDVAKEAIQSTAKKAGIGVINNAGTRILKAAGEEYMEEGVQTGLVDIGKKLETAKEDELFTDKFWEDINAAGALAMGAAGTPVAIAEGAGKVKDTAGKLKERYDYATGNQSDADKTEIKNITDPVEMRNMWDSVGSPEFEVINDNAKKAYTEAIVRYATGVTVGGETSAFTKLHVENDGLVDTAKVQEQAVDKILQLNKLEDNEINREFVGAEMARQIVADVSGRGTSKGLKASKELEESMLKKLGEMFKGNKYAEREIKKYTLKELTDAIAEIKVDLKDKNIVNTHLNEEQVNKLKNVLNKMRVYGSEDIIETADQIEHGLNVHQEDTMGSEDNGGNPPVRDKKSIDQVAEDVIHGYFSDTGSYKGIPDHKIDMEMYVKNVPEGTDLKAIKDARDDTLRAFERFANMRGMKQIKTNRTKSEMQGKTGTGSSIRDVDAIATFVDRANDETKQLLDIANDTLSGELDETTRKRVEEYKAMLDKAVKDFDEIIELAESGQNKAVYDKIIKYLRETPGNGPQIAKLEAKRDVVIDGVKQTKSTPKKIDEIVEPEYNGLIMEEQDTRIDLGEMQKDAQPQETEADEVMLKELTNFVDKTDDLEGTIEAIKGTEKIDSATKSKAIKYAENKLAEQKAKIDKQAKQEKEYEKNLNKVKRTIELEESGEAEADMIEAEMYQDISEYQIAKETPVKQSKIKEPKPIEEEYMIGVKTSAKVNTVNVLENIAAADWNQVSKGSKDISKDVLDGMIKIMPAIVRNSDKRDDMVKSTIATTIKYMVTQHGKNETSLNINKVQESGDFTVEALVGFENVLKGVKVYNTNKKDGEVLDMTKLLNDSTYAKKMKLALSVTGIVTLGDMYDLASKPRGDVENTARTMLESVTDDPDTNVGMITDMIKSGKIVPEAMFRRSAGRRWLKEMGLKLDDNKIEQGTLADIEMSLGEIVLGSMIRKKDDAQGTSRKHVINKDGKIVVDYLDDGTAESKSVPVVSLEAFSPMYAKELRDAARVLTYASEQDHGMISTEPAKKEYGSQVRNGNTILDDKRVDYINKQNETPWKFVKDMWDPILAEADELVKKHGGDRLEVLTWLLLGDRNDLIKNTQVMSVESELAKYDAEKLEIERMLMAYDLAGYDEFYVNWDVTISDRNMIDNKMINPQNSKLSRFIAAMPGMVHTIDPNNVDDVYEADLAVAQALDMDIDKQTDEKAFAEMAKKEYDRDTKKAVKPELENMLSGKIDISLENIRKWMPKVSSSEILHVYQAVQYMKNMRNGKPFETNLALEADGITNGMEIVMTQMGYSEYTVGMGDRGGVYWVEREGKREYKSHGEYKSEHDGKDIYEAPLDEILNNLPDNVNSAIDKVLVGKWRNFMKNPVMIFIYGAGMANIRQAIARSLIVGNGYIPGGLANGQLDGIKEILAYSEDSSIDSETMQYTYLDKNDKEQRSELIQYKTYNAKSGKLVDAAPGEIKRLQNNAKYISSKNPKNRKIAEDSINQLNQWAYMDEFAVSVVSRAIDEVIGQTFEDAFKNDKVFGPVIEFRQALKVVETMNYVKSNNRMKELIKKKGKTGITDMTSKELNEVFQEMIKEETYYGAKNVNGMTQDYVKIEKMSDTEATNKVKVVVQLNKYGGAYTEKSMYKNVLEMMSNVGAIGTTTVHDIDGTVMVEGHIDEVLNIYDALMMGVNAGKNKDQVQAMNKAFADINGRHSILGKAVEQYGKHKSRLEVNEAERVKLVKDLVRIFEVKVKADNESMREIMELMAVKNELSKIYGYLDKFDKQREAMNGKTMISNQYYASDRVEGVEHKYENVETVLKSDKSRDMIKSGIEELVKVIDPVDVNNMTKGCK